MSIKKFIEKIDKKKAFQLSIGVFGIYFTFLIGGILYEKLTSTKYLNSENQQLEVFRITSGFIMVERAINWWMGLIYQKLTLPQQQRVSIPTKNSAAAGFLIFLSSITQTQSMYLVSYPLIIMSKSCSLISVILVGLFCSRVRSKQLKLSPQKIIVVLIVTVGIIMFRLFDPTSNFDDNKSTELLGLLLLIISMFADGFIPDFQAEIKDKYKPQPIEMLITINKWCAICSFIYLVLCGQIMDFVFYYMGHPEFVRDLTLLAVFAFIGQLFIYRMIKQFKQHIVPFVCTTRKILTVGLSLFYFDHETSMGQIASILIVLTVTIYEFLDSIRKTPNQKQLKEKNITGENNSPTEISQVEFSQNEITSSQKGVKIEEKQ